MTARREVRGPFVGWDAWTGLRIYIHIGGDLPDWLRPGHDAVLIHADDHAALVAELEEWRTNAAALMEEVRGYERAENAATDADLADYFRNADLIEVEDDDA